MQRILFIGPKSPPVTGLAGIAKAVSRLLREQGHQVYFLCSVPRFASSLYPGPAWRFVRFIFFLAWALPRFLFKLPFHNIVYVKVSGGVALLFDCIFARIARLAGRRIFIHHNSFSYLNDRSSLAAMAFRAAGSEAIHVVNCQCMKALLESMYGLKDQTLIVSNATIMSGTSGAQKTSELKPNPPHSGTPASTIHAPLRVGFMSYYTEEKGLGLFCQTVDQAMASSDKIAPIAAGIVHDRDYFENLSLAHKATVDFCGPQYGSAKDEFFQQLDVLLFPSMYKTEAEPLVVHEALRRGIPVIATDIGCLPEVLADIPNCRSIPVGDYAKQVSTLLVAMSTASSSKRAAKKLEVYKGYLEATAKGDQLLETYLSAVSLDQADRQ